MRMRMKQIVTSVFAASALLVAASASQAATITLNPKGAPLSCAVADGAALNDCTAFSADNVTGSLGSNLTITNYQDPNVVGPPNSYLASYTETGAIQLKNWTLAGNDTKTSLKAGGNFDIWATFTLSGVGYWSKNALGEINFQATTGSLSNAALYADWNGTTVKIADINLLPGNLGARAWITANGTGTAHTDLSATFEIVPVSTCGGGGLDPCTGFPYFFESPAIWNIAAFVNNTGFGPGNGNISPSTRPPVDNQPLSFITTGWTGVERGGRGSFNGAFVRSVPEPGSLALFALALVGAGVASRRGASRRV